MATRNDSEHAAALCDAHLDRLYQLATFTTTDPDEAVRAVSCALHAALDAPARPSPAHLVGRRLAVLTHRFGRRSPTVLSGSLGPPIDLAAEAPVLLPARQHAVIALTLFGGLTYREAARELSVSASDAATLLRSALRRCS